MKLSKSKIKRNLDSFCADLPIFIYNSTDSTNTRAKEFAATHNEDAVFIANKQTAGRGRMGRRFISEGGKGLYLSILLGKEKSLKSGVAVTTYMAAIASRVLERLTSIKPQIKWVNDIYANGKKLSGILTEGKTAADGSLEFTVCGIGINLRRQRFDADVKEIATTVEDVSGTALDVNLLAAELIKEFFNNLALVGSEEIAQEYKKRSFLIGERVKVTKLASTYEAIVLDITDSCELLLSLENGTQETLSTGEVSVSIF